MPPSDDDTVSNSSDETDNIPLQNDDGWQDVEDDSENVQIISLFDDATFHSVDSMLQHCQARYGFNFLKIVKEFGV